jgi:hypothetical protein
MPASRREIIVIDSVTLLTDPAEGAVVVCGSHGGIVAGLFAAAGGVAGVVFNDAAVGKEEAGIAGLRLIEQYGIAAAAVDYRSARIGDGEDSHASGVISFINRWAIQAGVQEGDSAAQAADRMAAWQGPKTKPAPPPANPLEREPDLLEDGWPRVFALDSVSAVTWSMAGSVILGGSHGGIVNGKAIKAPVRAAFFNDAGGGKDGAGISRLPALDVCGIPGATVSAISARIGDGRDTYESGTISNANASAAALGIQPNQTASEAVRLIRAAARTAAGERTGKSSRRPSHQ